MAIIFEVDIFGSVSISTIELVMQVFWILKFLQMKSRHSSLHVKSTRWLHILLCWRLYLATWLITMSFHICISWLACKGGMLFAIAIACHLYRDTHCLQYYIVAKFKWLNYITINTLTTVTGWVSSRIHWGIPVISWQNSASFFLLNFSGGSFAMHKHMV